MTSDLFGINIYNFGISYVIYVFTSFIILFLGETGSQTYTREKSSGCKEVGGSCR